ncbi:hypothetical protein GCM10009863_21620 [Streptomyces axinellae]|uniref:Uncharacterized protein n=1 Tax=Streptomyces axinellae TaxID=552788 RepID=A0ABN3PY07_9ACTN
MFCHTPRISVRERHIRLSAPLRYSVHTECPGCTEGRTPAHRAGRTEGMEGKHAPHTHAPGRAREHTGSRPARASPYKGGYRWHVPMTLRLVALAALPSNNFTNTSFLRSIWIVSDQSHARDT